MTHSESSESKAVSLAVKDKVGEVQQLTAVRSHLAFAVRLLIVALAMVAIVATADYFLVIPTWLRAVAGLGVVAALVLQATGKRQPYELVDAAADVEASHPEFGQQIRTTLDYNDPSSPSADADPGFVSALTHDTEHRVETRDFRDVVDRRPLRNVAVAALVLLIALFATAWWQPELWISAARVLLLPAHYTNLTVTPRTEPIPTGADATIVAAIDGRPVESASLHYKLESSDRWQSVPLEMVSTDETLAADETSDAAKTYAPQKIAGSVAATLANCKESFDYRITAGPRESATYRITVLAPLESEELKVRVKPPAYTELAEEESQSLDLKVIEGTDIDFALKLSREPATAVLAPVDSATPNLTQLAIEGATVKGRFDQLSEAQHFVIRAESADGIAYESERFRIRVRPDAKPKIRFVRPTDDMEVIPTAEVALSVDASDDFGIRRVGVAVQVADGPMETLWEESFPEDDPQRNEARSSPVLFLEEHALTHQDAVSYHAYVVDNQPGGGKRTSTELRFIDIRPFKREYQMLQGGGT